MISHTTRGANLFFICFPTSYHCPSLALRFLFLCVFFRIFAFIESAALCFVQSPFDMHVAWQSCTCDSSSELPTTTVCVLFFFHLYFLFHWRSPFPGIVYQSLPFPFGMCMVITYTVEANETTEIGWLGMYSNCCGQTTSGLSPDQPPVS